MRQIQFQAFGKPEAQASCQQVDEPSASSGQVLVRILAAPINPADINYIEGTYGIKPQLPAVPGNEACAEVVACSPDVDNFTPGDHVVFLGRGNLWQDFVAVDANKIIKIPSTLDPLQACQLAVNPPTALLLLNQFQNLSPGSWIAQNAANSAVGQAVIQIAHSQGIKTLNFVRRESLFEPLKALGANATFLDEKESITAARELTESQGPSIAFNAVGGESALRLMDLLAPNGLLVTYGAMSRSSLKVPNSFLIFKRIQLNGLWVTEWFKEASPESIHSVFNQLSNLMTQGHLTLPIEKIYPPEDIIDALSHAQQAERSGKILLQFSHP